MIATVGMTTKGYLLDEHVPRALRTRLRRVETGIRVYAVGDDDAPSKSTPDPDLLTWIEVHDCLLVTNNRVSMPKHLADHLRNGRHVPGIVQLPEQAGIGAVVGDLLLILEAGSPDEFRDRITYLPL